jgi:probable HAF family extracellular repeat protein
MALPDSCLGDIHPLPRAARGGECPQWVGEHGFLDTGGSFTQLDVPGATDTIASGINDAGQVVGTFINSTGEHGFLDTGGSFTQFDVPSADITVASGINGAGQIVVTFDSITGVHGFLSSPSGTAWEHPAARCAFRNG